MKHKLSLDSLMVLEAIADSASFSGAAENLHCAPSSVTYAIQKLENRLGVLLFDRRGHRASLTAAGEALLREGRDLLALADGVSRNIMRIATGVESELRVVVSQLISYDTLLDACESFYRAVPNLKLNFTTVAPSETWNALVLEKADFVIGASGEPPAGGDYAIHRLGDIEYVFAVSPSHPIIDETKSLTSDIINKYRTITTENSPLSDPKPSKTDSLRHHTLVMPSYEVQREAQKRGLGVGYLPRHLASSDIEAGTLVELETEEVSIKHETLCYAWKVKQPGKALVEFKGHLCDFEKPINWLAA